MTTPKFTVNVDADSMTLGDYIDLTDGSPKDQVQALGRYIMVDGKMLTPDEGYALLRGVKMAELKDILETVAANVAGNADPN